MTKKKVQTDFIDVLMRQGDGATNKELSDNVREIVKRVVDTGKKGRLTLTMEFSEFKGTGQIVIEDKITMKLPEYDRLKGMAFADDEGNLLRDNPKQKSLFDQIVEVDEGDTAVVEIDGKKEVVDLATGEVQD